MSSERAAGRLFVASWLGCTGFLVWKLLREPAPVLLPFAAYASPLFWTRAAAMLYRAGGVLGAGYALGLAVLGAARLRREDAGGDAAALAAGLGLLATVIFSAGCLVGLDAGTLSLIIPLGAAAGAAALGWRLRRGPPRLPRPPLHALPLLVVIAWLSFCALPRALAPPTFYDSLHYHLPLQETFLLRGRIGPVPENAYAGLPALVETLYLPLLAADPSGTACQVLNWLLLLALLAAAAACAGELGGESAGLWAAAVVATCPAAVLESTQAMSELGWALFVAAALLVLLRETRAGGAALAGALAGFALGCKYQTFLALPAGAAFLYAARREGWRRRAAVFCAAALVVAAPWYLKNAAFYHDPFYPFLFRPDWPIDALGLRGASNPLHGYPAAQWWRALVDLPLRFWRDALPTESVFPESQLSPLLPVLLPLLLFVKLDRRAKAALAFGLVLWVPMSLWSRLPRFQLPAACALAALAGAAAAALPGRLRRLAPSAAALTAIPVWLVALAACDYGASDLFVRGRLTQREYLAQVQVGYAAPPYPAYAWMNEQLPEGARVLVAAEYRDFYLKRDRIGASLYAREPLLVYLERAGSAEGLYAALRRRGITHLFVNGMNREMILAGLPASELADLRTFWARHLKLARRDHVDAEVPGVVERDLLVYELVDNPPATPAPFID